ncbi:MAG: MarC family protein [Muribaculaceae bacterium]|nr:MarC family protein [Muribaculaceae bacterium]
MLEALGKFDIQQIASAFIVLLAIIDIIGAIPIILDLEERGRPVSPNKATFISLGLMLGFYFGGTWILSIFGVTIEAFAAAGSLLLFFMALEMVCDMEIFKNNGPVKEATLVPIVFPLVAGPGVFTTLISLKAMYADVNILLALLLNMIWVYVVIRLTRPVKRLLGPSGIYFVRKFFGVVLLAIAVKMFSENISALFKTLN